MSYLGSNIDYELINRTRQANDLSKASQHHEALSIFDDLWQQNQLNNNRLIESYLWCIYRYLNHGSQNLATDKLYPRLKLYFQLKPNCSEILNSAMLRLAIKYTERDTSFPFWHFLKSWGVGNFSAEDFESPYFQGKFITPLFERVVDTLVKLKNPELLKKFYSFRDNDTRIIDLAKKMVMIDILQAIKAKQSAQLWPLIKFYQEALMGYSNTEHDSTILDITITRFEKKNPVFVYNFFKTWIQGGFRPQDWRETINGEFTKKALAIRAFKLVNNCLNNDQLQKEDFTWCLSYYPKLLEVSNNDQYILRDYASLHIHLGHIDEAFSLYKKLAISLAHTSYFWHEYGQLLYQKGHIDEAINAYARALLNEQNEDHLGNIHLNLATALIDKQLYEQARAELDIYYEHYDYKGWGIDAKYDELMEQLKDCTPSADIRSFYRPRAALAEEQVFKDYPWTSCVLNNILKTSKGNLYNFNNYQGINFKVRSLKSFAAKQLDRNRVFDFKLQQDKKTGIYKVLLARPSRLSHEQLIKQLPVEYAVVKHINSEKNLYYLSVRTEQPKKLQATSSNRRAMPQTYPAHIRFKQVSTTLNIGDQVEIRTYPITHKETGKKFRKVIYVHKLMNSTAE